MKNIFCWISFTREQLGYYLSGVELDKLPSDSFTSPVFLNISKIQHLVWMDFSVSDLKFNYRGRFKIKFSKIPFKFIGEQIEFGHILQKKI